MMRRFLVHILVFALSAILLTVSCRKDEAEVIPRDTLAEIYSEMLLTDQWIVSTPNVRIIADTSLVYEPILEKYGYDPDDYRKSVDVYMNDPERFARILRETGEILKGRLERLEKRKAEIDRIKLMKARMERFRPDISFGELFPYLGDEPYVHYYDSVSFEPDSTHMYRLVSFETSDTLFDGVRMVIKDTLTVKDTLAAADEVIEDVVKENVDTSSVKTVRKVDASQQPQLLKINNE